MNDNIDKAAHDLMNFKPQKVTRVHGYEVFYHEERLYTVRDSNTGITSLVYAREPREAAEKVIKMTVEQPMSAVEYGDTLVKICASHNGRCAECEVKHPCAIPDKRTVPIVEKWAKEHPERRSE